MKKAIAFDLDGTLFQVHLVAVPAYITVFTSLAEQGLIDSVPSVAKFNSVFGMTAKEIWEYLLPGTTAELKEKVARWVIEEEEKLKELGKLFPGARDTLETLANMGHPLFVVSNGTEEYV